jgi:hypothetical protein
MSIINKNIIVYPHLEWNIEFDNEKALYKYVDKVISYFNLDITLWTNNSFALNDIGFWNAVISVEVDGLSYFYMFRYNYDLKILYGCPCINKDITNFKHTSLSYNTNPSLFNIFQSGLIKNND